jgi:hypothetical protein
LLLSEWQEIVETILLKQYVSAGEQEEIERGFVGEANTGYRGVYAIESAGAATTEGLANFVDLMSILIERVADHQEDNCRHVRRLEIQMLKDRSGSFARLCDVRDRSD